MQTTTEIKKYFTLQHQAIDGSWFDGVARYATIEEANTAKGKASVRGHSHRRAVKVVRIEKIKKPGMPWLTYEYKV